VSTSNGQPNGAGNSHTWGRLFGLTVMISAPFWLAAIFSQPFQGAFGHDNSGYHPLLAPFNVFAVLVILFTLATSLSLQLKARPGTSPWIWGMAATGVWCTGGLLFLIVAGFSAIGFGQGTSRTNFTAWGGWISICGLGASAWLAHALAARLTARAPTSSMAGAALVRRIPNSPRALVLLQERLVNDRATG